VQRIENFIAKIRQYSLVEIVESENSLIKIIDCDENSQFSFTINNYKTDTGIYFHVRFDPADRNSLSIAQRWIAERSLDSTFDSWYLIIKEYEKSFVFSDDPIINYYADEYYAQFEIIDDDAWKPLEHNKMLLLDKQLKYIEENIEKEITEDNEAEIIEIKKEASKIRNILTKEPRASLFRKTAVLWAKIKKQGLHLSRIFVEESIKSLAKIAIETVLIP
jgi:hypothetical protein